MWINPYQDLLEKGCPQIRGNFHTHAGQIDPCSVNSLEDTRALYEKLGYGLLTVSNHNKLTALQHGNPPGAPLQFLDGYEHTVDNHMLCLGVGYVYDPVTDYQALIDDVNARGGLVILCHPNWQHEDYWPDPLLRSLTGYCGIEVVNGVITRLMGSAVADREWDMLLTARKRVWGFGNDDYHLQSDAGRAWTMILADSNDPGLCLDALRRGAHYASTGMVLHSLAIADGVLRCEAGRIRETHVKRFTYRFYGCGGRLLREEYAGIGACPLPDGEGYVRVQVLNEEGAMLWTQPVYSEGWFRS